MTYSAELNGVTLHGNGDDSGWVIERVSGLLSSGSHRQAERVVLPGRHGAAAAGADLRSVGLIEFELARLGAPSAVEEACLALAAAWAPMSSGSADLSVQAAGPPRVAVGRPVAVDVDLSLLAAGAARARCVFERLDPLWYSPSWSSAALSLAPSTGGWSTPLETPLETTASGGARDAQAMVGGTAPTPWRVSVVPSSDLVGAALLIDGVPVVSVTDGVLPAGSVATLDSATHELRVDGYLRPWVSLSSTWVPLSPGGHTLSLRAVSGSGSGSWLWREASF